MIKLVNVSKYYNSNNVIALGLRKVNLELHVNEFVAIIGESGSGKTTLLNVISGIDSYEDGEMYINGEETSYYSVMDMENYRKKYVAFVFQNYNLIDSYTVLQNVEAPLILSGYPKNKIRPRAMEIIRRVGLEKHIHHKATKLSGGQKQRVVIARALAKDCPIIAADEPTGNLDSESAKQIIELLHEISKDKLVIVVTHDYDQVKEYATRKIRIFDGEIVEDQEMKRVNKENLPKLADQQMRIKPIEFFRMALRNLFSVPKKTVLMVLVFSFFAFFVAMVYGAFNINMSDYSYNYNYYFQNASVSRVIVRKSDKSPLTQDDLNELLGLSKVQTVVPYDYYLDYSYYMSREQLSTDGNDWVNISGTYLPDTVIQDENDLDYGRMPQTINEVVLAVSQNVLDNYEEYLGRRFSTDASYDNSSNTVYYEVVGLINAAKIFMDMNSSSESYMLFSNDQFLEMSSLAYFRYVSDSSFTGTVVGDSTTFTVPISYEYYSFYIDEQLEDDVIVMPTYYYDIACESTTYCEAVGDFEFNDFYTTYTVSDVTLRYGLYNSVTEWSYKDNYVRMNSDTMDKLLYDEIYQVSVIANTDLNVSGLVDQIARIDKTILTSKYKVFYPYDSQSGDPFTAIILVVQTIGIIALVFATILFSTLITYVIFKAIINTKLHDYAIFRTIGANQKMITNFIYLENVFVVLFSFVLFIAVTVVLKNSSTVGGFFYPLQTFDWGDYIVFFGILLLMSLFISRKYCNRIFGESVNRVLKAE